MHTKRYMLKTDLCLTCYVYIFMLSGKEALIISDSITRDFPTSTKYDLITIRGATICKVLDHITENRYCVKGYKIIVLHVGTNHFSSKKEWSCYLQLAHNKISKATYDQTITEMNPPPANGQATAFRDEYLRIIKLIKHEVNVKILVSAVVPRLWDHDRRDLVRRSYNRILEKFQDLADVYFIPSFKPFFNKDRILRKELFLLDGLHLSNLGTTVLCTYICDCVCRCVRGELERQKQSTVL